MLNQHKQIVIIQGSSRTWSGGNDLCMKKVKNFPAIYWTVKKALGHIPGAEVIIAAPEFDRNSNFVFLIKEFSEQKCSIYYGHDDSPLDRMLDVCKTLSDNDYIIRIDGAHMFFNEQSSVQMVEQAVSENLDCCKFPDDFPVQLTCDVYRVGAMRTMSKLMNSPADDIYKAHPKFYMFLNKNVFKCAFINKLPEYSDDFLMQCREIASEIYDEERDDVNESKVVKTGEQLYFFYDLSSKYLDREMKVLDPGCGNGYGTRIMSKHVLEAHGVDIDPDIIKIAREQTPENTGNVYFHVDDITKMSFDSNYFDGIVSMGTVEHVDGHLFMKEACRVLKPGGVIILSTPQNSLGHIPINPKHLREFSLSELMHLCEQYVSIEHVIGNINI